MSGVLAAVSANSGWIALAALVAGVIALVWLALLNRRVRVVSPDIRRLVRGMQGKRFDEVLRDLLGNMEFLGGRLGRVEVAVEELSRRQKRAVQHLGLVRYNAEQSLGGELSFALALLDASHNGVIVTSLHTLEECRIYLRTVEQGRCAHDLNEEEAAALEIALRRRRPEASATARQRRPRWRAKERTDSQRSAKPEKRGEPDGE
jgi:hypothetical protein